MWYIFDDGGRAAAGFRGFANDCVTRAIAIASGMTYSSVYADLNELAAREMPNKKGRRSHPRTGVHRRTYEPYLLSLGAVWVPTMVVGQGCTTHLRDGELPAGRLVARLSRHCCAVIDGVIHDTFDPSRGGTRCVYGYFNLGTTVPPKQKEKVKLATQPY